MPQRRPVRDVNDWGTVDIEALTLSIRSRLSTELSYALTTFSLLSTMKGQSPGSGFPINQCQDLLDEVLDLLEDTAFDGAEDSFEPQPLDSDEHITTNRELVNAVYDLETQPFASLEIKQGSKDRNLGPRQRPGNLILVILNIIRNLSVVPDNMEFISRQGRLVDLILRVCAVTPAQTPASPALSLSDLIAARKDVLHILSAISTIIHFSHSSRDSAKLANRAFQLVASYLVDPSEAVSPFQSVQVAGVPLGGNLKPPSLADVALEVFTKLGHSDTNRHLFAKCIPQSSLSRLFKSLVHRLPVLDADFQLVTREAWLSYLEKNIMSIYSLAFLAPPDLKTQWKEDRSLGFKGIMLRLVRNLVMGQDTRPLFSICARRAVEAMKVLDDGEDLFDTSKSAAPMIAFGMGYGEVGENGAEKGTGLLGGHRDLAWDMLMVREVWSDDVMFGELESLARVE